MVGQRVRHLMSVGVMFSLISTCEFKCAQKVFASTTIPIVKTRFISVSGANWSQLAHGAYGSGYILYYLPNHSPSHPSLVVRLARAHDDPNAIAQVFDAPRGLNYVPVSLNSGSVVPDKIQPTIFMTAIGGWWIKHDTPNYNLDVQINKPMYAMWGEPTYQNILPTNAPDFSIEVRSDSRGQPLWDWRTLVPPVPHEGVYRANYSQRESDNVVKFAKSVSALFPYVAYSGAFEQPSGSLVPPIVVDWKHGKITDFSEIVTVRDQSSSYDFYSLSSLIKGNVNDPNFESPWGLYNLSNRKNGYPNLVIRTEHYGANDPASIGIDQSFITAPLMNYPSDEFRYSWADHPGNQLFDYKVDVFGFHPYTKVQSIAGGALKVVAPSYTNLPNWVITHTWNAITFVDTNGGGYPTSEGIYDWTARDIGNSYWRGWTTVPDLTEFQNITKGFRGEYEVGVTQRPKLYVSPIDNRFHLLHAQGGLWNLGNNLYLKEGNLDGGPYIDAWVLEKSTTVLSQLYQSHGFIVEADKAAVRIQTDRLQQSTTTVRPPTDHRSWVHFRRLAAQIHQKSPNKMASWIPYEKGNSMVIPSASLQDFRDTKTGFELVLNVSKSHPVPRTIASTLHLPAPFGHFVVDYSDESHAWAARYAKPSLPKLTVELSEIHHQVAITLTNAGNEGYSSPMTVAIDNQLYHIPTVRLHSQQSDVLSLPLYPSRYPTYILIKTPNGTLYRHIFPAPSYVRPLMDSLWKLSSPLGGTAQYWMVAILLGLILTTFIAIHHKSREEQR